MEAFEQFVAVALEAERLVVSPAVKFRVQRRTKKASCDEFQTHGYEVDLVAARADRLVLATVKSFFGSQGVVAEHVVDKNSKHGKRYMLLNDEEIREGVMNAVCKEYGYKAGQVQLRLYVGKFAAPKTGTHEAAIREWCAGQHVGAGPIEVFGVEDVVAQVRRAAAEKQYRDNPVLVTMKVLQAAGLLSPAPPNLAA